MDRCLGQSLLDDLRGDGQPQQEPLPDVAAEPAQGCQISFGLDALRNRLKAECATKVDDGARHCGAFVVAFAV